MYSHRRSVSFVGEDFRRTLTICNNFPWPVGVNVANVKMLPKLNVNAQLKIGNIVIGNPPPMATISKAE